MTQARSDDRRYLDDFAVGQRLVAAGEYVMQEPRMVEFATDYDPQPIHTDPASAAAELFGGLVASGWHTLGATTRLVMGGRPFGSTPIVGVGIDNLRFLEPVRAGDVLTAEAEVLDVRPSRTHPDRGYLVLRVVTSRRSDDAPVLTQDWTLLLPRRGAMLDVSG
jgi:acyl dehydratase